MKKVLFCDDSDLIISVIKVRLVRSNDKMDITVAQTMEEVKALKHIEFDIAIIDWFMGSHTGNEIFDQITSKEYFISSFSNDNPDMLNFIDENEIKFIGKPITVDKLKEICEVK